MGILAVGALAVLVRLIYLFEAGDDPTFQHPIVDCAEYDHLAKALAQGRNPWPGALTRPPLYPGLLAVVYWLCGVKLTAAYVFHALLGGLTCVLTCLLGRRLFDRRVGLAAGIVVALYGPMIFFDMRRLASGLVVLCYLAVLLLAVRAAARRTPLSWLACGIATGVAALARPSIAPFFLIVLTAWIIVQAGRERRWRARLLALTALASGSVLPIVPVTVRNYLACGEFIPVAALSGLNLYIGNNPEWQRTIALRPGPGWNTLTRLPHANGQVSHTGIEAYFRGRVTDYVRNQPGDFLAGLLRKTRLYFNAREVPRNFDLHTHRRFSRSLSTLVWQMGPFAFPFGVLLPLAVVGFAAGCRQRPQCWLAMGFVAAAAGSVILFFNASRYRMPIVPVLAVLAVSALVWLCRQVGTGRLRRFGVGLAAVVVAGIGVNLPAAAPTDQVNFEAELYDSVAARLASEGDLGRAKLTWMRALRIAPDWAEPYCSLSHLSLILGQPAEARRYAQRAVQLDPELADARLCLGTALMRLQLYDASDAEFREAIRIEPGHPTAHAMLGQLFIARGQPAGAIEHLRRSIHFNNTDPATYVDLADALIKQGRYAEALSALEDATRRLPNPDLRNTLAWLLATCPDPVLRDPERAVRLAEQNVTESQARNPIHLDTLAAAYASAGRFEKAAEWATRALGLATAAGANDLARGLSARRQLYLSNRPCEHPVR